MELTGTELIFSWLELRDAVREGTIERIIANVDVLLKDGFSVSVHVHFREDLLFANIDEFKAYIATIHAHKSAAHPFAMTTLPPPKKP